MCKLLPDGTLDQHSCWERFDYHEDNHWRRRKVPPPTMPSLIYIRGRRGDGKPVNGMDLKIEDYNGDLLRTVRALRIVCDARQGHARCELDLVTGHTVTGKVLQIAVDVDMA